jgi:chaperonin cofactor prefoldin
VAGSERMEDLEMKVERLEEENASLKDRLRKLEPTAESEA